MTATPTSSPAHCPPDLPNLCLAVTEHAPLPIATVDGATHIVRYANPAFCRLMDKPIDQLLGKPISELLPKKDECVSLLDRVFRTKKPESHIEKESSRPHPVFWSYLMWPVLADELLVGVMIQVTETAKFHENTVAMNEALLLGSVRQHELTAAAESLNAQLRERIVERQRAEEALRESEDRYRTLFASAPMAVFACDRDAVIQQYNLHAAELWGRAPVCGVERYCGSVNLWLSDGTCLPHSKSPIVEVLRTGVSVLNVEVLIERPDGTRLPVLVNFAALKNVQGEITGAITSFIDITERKKTEEVLRAAQAQLAERADQLEALVAERTARLQETVGELEAFSYSIAHDMRAPLRAMAAFTALVRTEHSAQLDEAGQGYLTRVASAAQRLDRLITDVLSYSSVARRKLDLQPVDLEKLLEEAVRNQPEFQSPQAEIEIRKPMQHVLAHEPSLMQCANNLLSNAVKFVAHGIRPRVTVRSELIGPEVRLWFEDNGIGIEAADQQRIFALFGRLHPVAEFEGTGIGLTIVRKAAERMGGTVGLESKPGQGSRFWIQLKKSEEI